MLSLVHVTPPCPSCVCLLVVSVCVAKVVSDAGPLHPAAGIGRRGGGQRERARDGRGRGRNGGSRRHDSDRPLAASYDATAASSVKASTGGFHLPALDGLAAKPAGGDGAGRRKERSSKKNRGGADDPLLPDSLLDGGAPTATSFCCCCACPDWFYARWLLWRTGSDWKTQLDEEGHAVYRELGLELYNATSLDEMSAAMRALQDFERAARAAAGRGATSVATAAVAVAGADGDEHFRQVAMSFYKSGSGVAGRGNSDSGFEGAQKAALAAQLDRERKRAEKEGRLIQTF